MTLEEKKKYKELSRKVDEAYTNMFKNGKRVKSPANYNNRLAIMKGFLQSIEGDFTNNKYMKSFSL